MGRTELGGPFRRGGKESDAGGWKDNETNRPAGDVEEDDERGLSAAAASFSPVYHLTVHTTATLLLP